MMFKKAVASALISSFTFTSVMCTYSNTTPMAEPKMATQDITEFVKGMRKPGTTEDEQPTLTNGDSGALNLALLSDPKVLQYVKDYFKITKDAEDGKIFDFRYQLPCHAYFGMNLAEQGIYKGTLIPKSYIPKSKVVGSYGGNATLFNYNNTVCGSVGVEPGCDSDAYFTCFQLDKAHATGKVGAFKTPYTGGAGKSVTGEHRCDRYYFPDQLYQVVARLNGSMHQKDKFKTGTVKKEYLTLIGDLAHARGEGAIEPYVGVPLKGDNGQLGKYCKVGTKEEYEEYMKQINLYGDYFFAKPIDYKYLKNIEFDAPMQRIISCIYFMNVGWKMLSSSGSEIFRTLNRRGAYGDEKICGIFQAVTGQKKTRAEITAWVKSNVVNGLSSRYNKADYGLNAVDFYPGNLISMRKNGIMIKEENYTSTIYKAGNKPVLRYSDNLNLGHALTAINLSKFMYGALLASMKLPVDPANPSTYLVGGNGGGKPTGNTGVTPAPEIKKGDYVPSGNIVKPTCAVRNVVPARSGVQLLQKGLCAYFTKDGKPNANTIVGNPGNFSPINSVGEKDGMPVFTQGQYYTNGVKDYNGYRMPAQGCPIFAFCSLMYGAGMGTDKSPHLTNELKKVLASSDCPSIGGTKYLTPMALAKGLDWLHGGSPWTAYNNMFKKKLNIDVVSKTWSPNRKAKDLEEFEKELAQGYGFVLSVTSKKMKWYRPKDLAKKEVEFACDSVVTGGNHFITIYTIDTYKDVKSGKTFKGVQVIDGANLCGHSRGRFLAGECDNDFILDLSSLHDAKNFGSPFHRFTFPISATAPSSSNSSKDSDNDSQTGGHYVILDDTVRALNSRHSIIDKVACTGGNKGYVTWSGEKLSNFYIFPQDVVLANEGSTLIYKAEDGMYYKLSCFKGKFNNLTTGTYNTMNKVLSAQDDILIEKFMDSDCTTPIDFIEDVRDNYN